MNKLKSIGNGFSAVINKMLDLLKHHEIIDDDTHKNVKNKINPNKRIFYILLVMVLLYFGLSILNSLFSFPVILIVSILVGTYLSPSSSSSS